MQKLYFDYYTKITYSETVAVCYYTIKCIPATTDRQKLEQISVEIEPKDSQMRGEDSFGNQFLYGSVDRPHEQFFFHIKGIVQAGITDYEKLTDEGRALMYRYPSALTAPGEGIRTYYATLNFPEEASDYERAVYMMHKLYQDFVYEKNVTGVGTTAEEAWKLGKGVCQDYAHIMITLCRLAGIPARYVAGMMIGEGYSHAWVEVLTEGKWYALDPTNDVIVGDEYIKIGNGRDAADCTINKGLVTGGGEQSQTITVKVSKEPIEPFLDALREAL